MNKRRLYGMLFGYIVLLPITLVLILFVIGLMFGHPTYPDGMMFGHPIYPD